MEVQAFLESNSATVGKGVLEAVYKLATSQPFQFIYVNLKTTDTNEMFYIWVSATDPGYRGTEPLERAAEIGRKPWRPSFAKSMV